MWAFKATVQVVYCTGVTGLFGIPCGLWLVHNLHGGRQRPWPCINTPSCKFLLSSVLQTIEKSKCHAGVCPCSSLYQGHWCKGAKKRPEQQVGTSFIFWEAMDMNTKVSVCDGLDMSLMCPCVKGSVIRGFIRRYWGPLEGESQWGRLGHWECLFKRNCKMPAFSLFLTYCVHAYLDRHFPHVLP